MTLSSAIESTPSHTTFDHPWKAGRSRVLRNEPGMVRTVDTTGSPRMGSTPIAISASVVSGTCEEDALPWGSLFDGCVCEVK
ncbi:MAG: hypothetical protein HC898_00300 [Phycisphaerales bacterium]|nr:hypothetical protein [Phycisphaerales bacterium]